MKPIIFISAFVLAASAVPIAIDVNGSHHLQRRDGTDDLIGSIGKALVVFAGFIWGGGIISRRAVDYYFEKLNERTRQSMMEIGKVHSIIGNGTGGGK